MIVSLFTPTPQFANDLADVVRIFLGNIDFRLQAPEADLRIVHQETEENGLRRCQITASGVYSGAEQSALPINADLLLDKRYRKRQMKQALYAILKRALGRTPPWGSLTGIRPTRLLYEGMARGLTLDQAMAETQATFDVAPGKAELLREIVAVQLALPQPQHREIDLYVGVPFCVSRCAYCSFLSGEVGKGRQLLPYTEALEKEIAGTLQLIK